MNVFNQKLEELGAQPDARVLDVGGWFAPCRLATHIVDIMPFETLNRAGAYGPGELKVRPENYHRIDLSSVERLPFEDKAFDFVICRHTLEDIKDPLSVCREIVRVGKAGYIETPHRVYESTKGVERHWWCGHYHHRWLVEIEGNRATFQFKPHNLHASPSHHWRCWPWQKVREPFKNTGLLWEGGFEFGERILIDYDEVKRDLSSFKARYSGQRLKRLRWQRD